MSFWLATVVNVYNPLDFVNAHFTQVCCWCKECTLIKLIGLLLTTMASQNDIHSCLAQAEKGKVSASTLSHKMCPRKQTTEPKWLILICIFFSQKITHPLIPLLHLHIIGKFAVSFLLGHPVYSGLVFNGLNVASP